MINCFHSSLVSAFIFGVLMTVVGRGCHILLCSRMVCSHEDLSPMKYVFFWSTWLMCMLFYPLLVRLLLDYMMMCHCARLSAMVLVAGSFLGCW